MMTPTPFFWTIGSEAWPTESLSMTLCISGEMLLARSLPSLESCGARSLPILNRLGQSFAAARTFVASLIAPRRAASPAPAGSAKTTCTMS